MMPSNYHASNGLILTLFALCNSTIAIALPTISSPDLSPRGRPIFNPIDCDADLPPFPRGLQSRYHNLRNVCARDSVISSGNMGCFCANEVLYCPTVSNNPGWLAPLRTYCFSNCDCGANTKARDIIPGVYDSLDLSDAPWNVQGIGPNPFADVVSFPLTGGTCTICSISGSSVLPRDEEGNCSCVNSSSITPRDGVSTDHARLLDNSREVDI